MRDLILTPDTPWRGFLKGFSATALALGLPILTGTIIRVWDWRALSLAVPFALLLSLLGGPGLALWRFIQWRAYESFKAGPRE